MSLEEENVVYQTLPCVRDSCITDSSTTYENNMDNDEINTEPTSNTNSQRSSATVDYIEKVLSDSRLVINKSIASNSTTLQDNQNSVSRRSSTDPEEIVHLDFSEDSPNIRESEFFIADSNVVGIRQKGEVRRAGIIKYFNNIAKVIYFVLFVARLPMLFVYLGYDVKCAINEHATFANCTQEFFVTNPKNWVLYSKTTSTLSSLILLFIIWCNRENLNYNFYRALKQLIRKASFWLTNVMFVLTFVYYIIRIDGSDIQLSIALLSWWPATLVVVYSLNYLRPRDLPDLWFTIGYWFTIVMYCAETFCVFVAVLLSAHLNIIPLINRRNVDYKIKAFASLVVITRATFAGRLLTFFWHKIFHGGKNDF